MIEIHVNICSFSARSSTRNSRQNAIGICSWLRGARCHAASGTNHTDLASWFEA